MLPFLRSLEQPSPPWLRRLTRKFIQAGPGPWMDRLVKSALVYPGSGLDGSPVRQCVGTVDSFIFLDYGTGAAEVEAELTRLRRTGTGFANHHLLGMCRFDPRTVLGPVPEPFGAPPNSPMTSLEEPFGIWAVYEHNDRPAERFSFLFLGLEAIATLASLFPRTAPRILVLQEHGFGGNCWPSLSEPIVQLSEAWESLPQVIILGPNRWVPTWPEQFTSVGSDTAHESMHQSEREFLVRRPFLEV